MNILESEFGLYYPHGSGFLVQHLGTTGSYAAFDDTIPVYNLFRIPEMTVYDFKKIAEIVSTNRFYDPAKILPATYFVPILDECPDFVSALTYRDFYDIVEDHSEVTFD